MTQPSDFGFDVLDLGDDANVAVALKSLVEQGHSIKITGVMNNGNLQAVVTPAVRVANDGNN